VFVDFRLTISEPTRALSSMNSLYKWLNYDFCISQDSVATVLKRDGQYYSGLHLVLSWCRVSKIIKIGQCFTKLFEIQKWHVFMDHGVVSI